MISSALYRFFGMVQISSVGVLPLSIWTQYFGLGQRPIRRILLAACVAALTILAYLPALNGEFLWDDYDNIVQREVIQAPDGLVRIWTDLRSTQQYYPLTHSVFWLLYQLFGEWTLPYHLLNLALHLTASWLVFRLLEHLRIGGAGIAAGLFALSPLHVESVAWITELKNTLSAPLALAAAWLLLSDQKSRADAWQPGELNGATGGGSPSTRPGARYFGVLGLFVLALLAKTSVSVAAVALLLCSLWQDRNTRPHLARQLAMRRVVEVVPLLVLGLAAGSLTAWLEVEGVNAHGAAFEQGAGERILRAGRILLFYPTLLLSPVGHSFVYPRWHVAVYDPVSWAYALLAFGVVATSIAWARARRNDAIPLAVACYGVLLFPALGFFNVAFMRWTFVQDHFCYLASVPLVALVGAALSRLADSYPKIAGSFVTVGVLGLAAGSAGHAVHFATYDGLFEHATKRAPHSSLANYNLGVRYQQQGRTDEAIERFRRALVGQPDMAAAHANLAIALHRLGRYDEAARGLQRAIELEPLDVGRRTNYALVLDDANEHREAAVQYRAALRLDPDSIRLQRRLAWLLATSTDANVRDGREAVHLADRACSRTEKMLPRCLSTLAAAQAEAGSFDLAAQTAARASELARTAGDEEAAASYEAMRVLFARGETIAAARGSR